MDLFPGAGDRAGALEALEMALECSPDNYVVLLDLGKLLATPSDAQDDLERASAAHDHLERAKREKTLVPPQSLPPPSSLSETSTSEAVLYRRDPSAEREREREGKQTHTRAGLNPALAAEIEQKKLQA